MPDEMPEVSLPAADGGVPIANALKEAGLVSSTSEALRMLKQGAVRIDGERVDDRALMLVSGADVVCQVGKRRFARILIG
jgi:tyrosyl-tRNA synthetase